MDPDWRCFPIEQGDIPASYVSLPQGNPFWQIVAIFAEIFDQKVIVVSRWLGMSPSGLGKVGS